MTALSLRPLQHAAADLEELAERDAHRQLVVAGLLDVARHGEDHGAARIRHAHLGEPLGALAQDRGHRGERERVVDRRRLAVQAEVRRERRLEARLAGLALERLEERRLLAADVRAGAGDGMQVEVDAGALDVLAEEPGRIGFRERRLEPRIGLREELAADVVVADGRAHGVAADRHALDHRVRVEAQDVAVVAGARLALVRVADDVLLAGGAARHEAPLHAGREARAAAALAGPRPSPPR